MTNSGPGDQAASTATSTTASGLATETKLFLSVGASTVVIFVIYAAVADDTGGKALLAITATFSLVMAGYLFFRDRRGGVELEAETAATDVDQVWFPEGSLWPITIAGGVAGVVAGLALGPWIWLPGGLLLARGLWGFLMQSRHRD